MASQCFQWDTYGGIEFERDYDDNWDDDNRDDDGNVGDDDGDGVGQIDNKVCKYQLEWGVVL